MAQQPERKAIEELQNIIRCPKDFICYASKFNILGKAEEVGMKSFLKCLEGNGKDCPFSLGFAGAYYCHCLIRVYIAKTLGKWNLAAFFSLPVSTIFPENCAQISLYSLAILSLIM